LPLDPRIYNILYVYIFTNLIILLRIFVLDAVWTNWSGWSMCSVTCGTGAISRSRVCDNSPPARDGAKCTGPNEETTECFQEPCPGKH